MQDYTVCPRLAGLKCGGGGVFRNVVTLIDTVFSKQSFAGYYTETVEVSNSLEI